MRANLRFSCLSLLLVVAVLGAAPACSTFNPQAPGCGSDSDCSPGYTCSKGACNLPPDAGSASGIDAGGVQDAGTADSGVAAGPGTISGTAHGAPFTSVAAALYAGAPDDPATLVVDLFSQPVACATITSTGWDARIPKGTQVT